MGKHYPPHTCGRPGCGRVTRNKTYCSNMCSKLASKARRIAAEASKMHPCPICGDQTLTTICSKASCLSEFLRHVGHSRVVPRTRVCSDCGRKLPIAKFHRLTGEHHRHYYFSRACHDCRPENAYVPGEAEPAQEEEATLNTAEVEPTPPSIPLAGEAHGRWAERAWGDLRLGDPCFPVPGNSTSAAPFAA
jgi:hypothetical protein